LRLFSFGGYGLALAALALVVFGAIECSPDSRYLKYRGPYFGHLSSTVDRITPLCPTDESVEDVIDYLKDNQQNFTVRFEKARSKTLLFDVST